MESEGLVLIFILAGFILVNTTSYFAARFERMKVEKIHLEVQQDIQECTELILKYKALMEARAITEQTIPLPKVVFFDDQFRKIKIPTDGF